MATTSTRSVEVSYSGDVTAAHKPPVVANGSASGTVELLTLASGANTITPPTGGAAVPTGCVIIPPAANTTSLTLKGVTGDTGIRLHNTDPTVLALHSSVTTFVLTTGAQIVGVRFFWL